MKKGILITGGTQGIGLGIARQFAANGFHAFLNFKSNQAAAKAALAEINALGGTASVHQCDVRVPGDMEEMFDEITAHEAQLEAVVVNAVDEIAKPVDEATFEEWSAILSTKLDGAFLTTKLAIPALIGAENPSITYITSNDGVRPSGEYIAYQVGTAGLIAMSTAHAKYLSRKYGIRVNSVSPGPVKTGLWKKAGQSDEMWKAFDERSPIGRVATTKDVADAVWYLATDPNRFINGTTIHVDGGSHWV